MSQTVIINTTISHVDMLTYLCVVSPYKDHKDQDTCGPPCIKNPHVSQWHLITTECPNSFSLNDISPSSVPFYVNDISTPTRVYKVI